MKKSLTLNKKETIIHKVLYENNLFYQQLIPALKNRFIKRLVYFLKNIKFSTPHHFKLNFNVIVLTASGFIQITFGLRRYRLVNFNTIQIVDKPYLNKEHNLYFYGDTDIKNGQITLVWPIVNKGFNIVDDALNLALHEFSHALIIDNQARMTFRKFYRNKYLVNYLLEAKIEMNHLRNGESSIFRPYGATNIMEFFAVSIEAFFEQSDRFSSTAPRLYEKLSLLLNQDPRNVENPLIMS